MWGTPSLPTAGGRIGEAMILIWRGYGFLVPALAVAGFMAYILLNEKLHFAHPVVIAALCGGIGALYWTLGRRLNDPARDRLLLGGQHVRLTQRHDFFWIKLEYWAALPALLALNILFQWLTGMS